MLSGYSGWGVEVISIETPTPSAITAFSKAPEMRISHSEKQKQKNNNNNNKKTQKTKIKQKKNTLNKLHMLIFVSYFGIHDDCLLKSSLQQECHHN